MGVRKTRVQLEKIKKKYKKDRLWSWSKYNTYKTDPYGYLLKYIKKEKETKFSIYGVSGNVCHDILETLYKREIKYEDMLPKYEEDLIKMNAANLKYDRNDEDKNKTIARKYEGSMKCFFEDHIMVEGKVITEQFVLIEIGKHLFQGYIDFVHKDKDGNYIITDFKTSSIYTGKKVTKEQGQLVLYAESLIQLGVPIDKIKIRWNFLKYCTVEYQLKGIDKDTKINKVKTKNAIRVKWVKEIESNLRMWLKTMEYDELQIEDMVQTCIENNNLDILPDELKSRYKRYDCYVYIDLTQEVINDLKEEINSTLDEIIKNENEYQNTKDDKLFWTDINDENKYFFYNLCGYSPYQHKPFKDYLDNINMFTNDYINSIKKDKKDSPTETDGDLDWINDL